MNVRDAVRWFQGRLGFINDLPSWLNELLSGCLVVEIAVLLLYGLGRILGLTLWDFTYPLAFLLSELYEHTMDPWGYNPQDVVERSRGIVATMLVQAVLMRLQ